MINFLIHRNSQKFKKFKKLTPAYTSQDAQL